MSLTLIEVDGELYHAQDIYNEESENVVDKPVKHWHYTSDELPQEGKLLLVETIDDNLSVAEYKLKDYGYWKGCVFEDMSSIDWELCEVVKWMYIPEDEW